MDKDIQANIKRARAAAGKKVRSATAGLGESAKLVSARARATGMAAEKKLGAAKMRADTLAVETTRIITENPLASVAAAAAIGALAAGLLPRFLKRRSGD